METGKHILITIGALAVMGLLACGQSQSTIGGPSSYPPFGYNPYGGTCVGANCGAFFPSPSPSPSPFNTTTPNAAVPTPAPLSGGDTVVLNINNANFFSQQYVGMPLNNPSLVTLNLNVAPSMSGSIPVYLGQMHIRFNDSVGGSLILHDGLFTNGSWTDHGNNVHILTTEAGTNIPTYRLMFEDRYGVIIVTLQYANGGNADTGTGGLNGKVWLRNFNANGAPNPLYDSYFEPTAYCDVYSDPNCVWSGGVFFDQFPSNPYAFCWSGLITSSGDPYDCRNMSVQPSTSGQYAVTLLGTFTGMSTKALGN